jgi:putative ABC transport system substrate-binding protein
VIDRRTFLAGTGALLLAPPLVAEAQQPGKVYRIGSISVEAPTTPPGQGVFWDRMRELGWVYGQNVVIEYRAYGPEIERVPEMAKELIRLGTDVFLVNNSATALRVQQVTRTIPIVTRGGNLVGAGLAASIVRPGGNVTGIESMEEDVAGKQVQLLKETIPRLSRLGILHGQPGYSDEELRSKGAPAAYIREVKVTASALGLHTQVVIVRDGNDFERAFSAIREQRIQAVIVKATAFTWSFRKTIAALALKHRLPTMCTYGYFMSADFLMSYALDGRPTLRLIAETVDKILRGAKAGEIPLQQLTTFEFIINLKTAKALGLTIPPALLGRADEIIQ